MDSREIQPRVENGHSADSGQIKAEIDQTRGRIDETLEALADKLHPKHLIDEVIDYVRSPRQMTGTASKVGAALWHQIQEHPMPSLLIGAGIAWMLSEQSRARSEARQASGTWVTEETDFASAPLESETGSSIREKTGNLTQNVKEKTGALAQNVKEKTSAMTQNVKDKTGALAQSVKEKTGDLAHSVREKSGEIAYTVKEKGYEQAIRLKEAASHMKTHTTERASRVMHRAEETFSDASTNYPLALGLGFLAVGVLAGLALPHTRMEDKTLGQKADRLKDKVRNQGRQALETAQNAASAVAHTATEVAQREGLTPHTLGEKIKNIASETARAASDAAHREGLDQESLTRGVQTVAGETKRAAQEEMSQAKQRVAGGS